MIRCDSMSKLKAMITGISGVVLTEAEVAFIKDHQPWAFILFARNIGTADEVKTLTRSLREASGREDVFIFIDQEGGRVQRLRAPLAPNYPDARSLGLIYQQDKHKGLRAAWIMSRLHAFDLMRLGINANCLPLLDVPIDGAHDVIGVRAYANNPQTVSELGRAAADGLLAGGVLPVIKHIPGHGRAFCDTHLELAHVDVALSVLEASDFVPFQALADLPIAMTAHVVYDAVDNKNPATLSKIVINDIIRKKIGFDGLLMTDDLSMKALSGDLGDLTQQAFAAGCDIVLHCNGNMQEMLNIISHTPFLDSRALSRVENTHKSVGKADILDEAELRQEFASLLALLH